MIRALLGTIPCSIRLHRWHETRTEPIWQGLLVTERCARIGCRGRTERLRVCK